MNYLLLNFILKRSNSEPPYEFLIVYLTQKIEKGKKYFFY